MKRRDFVAGAALLAAPAIVQAQTVGNWPGTRPEGIGRFGSLIASTWRSNQSFTAWLVAQTKGPASITPARTKVHLESGETPEETMPQAKAHIGANHVIGFNSSRTAAGLGVSICKD